MPATRLATSGRDVARNCFGPLTVKITDDDHETVRRQSSSNCFTYAGRTAGDNRYTLLMISAHNRIPIVRP
jgi:hypothetical protein